MRYQGAREYKGQRVEIQLRAGGNNPGNASVTLVIKMDGQEVFRRSAGRDGMGQVEALAVAEVAKVQELGEEIYIVQFNAEAI